MLDFMINSVSDRRTKERCDEESDSQLERHRPVSSLRSPEFRAYSFEAYRAVVSEYRSRLHPIRSYAKAPPPNLGVDCGSKTYG